MSQADKRRNKGRLDSLTGAFKRHQEDRLTIDGYQVGDIRAEKAVDIAAGATLVGDLLAPEIVVAGRAYGYVACRQLVVAPGGQIWGDVYASSVELAPGGKINGWVCTLDAGTVDLLRAKELGTGDLPDQNDWRLPVELLADVRNAGIDVELDQHESQRRSGIWRQLRSEAALALIARSEIEATLEERLQEMLARQPKQATIEQAETSAAAIEMEEPPAKPQPVAEDVEPISDEVEELRAELRRVTAAAQKFYGELLWAKAELRASRRGDGEL